MITTRRIGVKQRRARTIVQRKRPNHDSNYANPGQLQLNATRALAMRLSNSTPTATSPSLAPRDDSCRRAC
eukprot:9608745-Lingulodinium_polyedra.AAC.1